LPYAVHWQGPEFGAVETLEVVTDNLPDWQIHSHLDGGCRDYNVEGGISQVRFDTGALSVGQTGVVVTRPQAAGSQLGRERFSAAAALDEHQASSALHHGACYLLRQKCRLVGRVSEVHYPPRERDGAPRRGVVYPI
jgi:hypothetical protein